MLSVCILGKKVLHTVIFNILTNVCSRSIFYFTTPLFMLRESQLRITITESLQFEMAFLIKLITFCLGIQKVSCQSQ